MKIRHFLFISLVVVGQIPANGAVTWDGGAGTALWSTANNWDTNAEPLATDDVILPAGLGATLTLATGEKAQSLLFADNYTLSSGGLALSSASVIRVGADKTGIINTPLTVTGGTTKEDPGTLVLAGSNTFAGGMAVNAGVLRVAHANAIGSSSNSATVADGAVLEVANGITFARAVALQQGSTLAGSGTATYSGTLTVNPAATALEIAAIAGGDLLTISSGIAGGGSGTTISLGGPGTVRLGVNGTYDGSWSIATGRLEVASATALGDAPSASVTLAGGVLAARANATIFTGSPGNNLVVTANSSLISDRTTATAGATHTFGSMAIGSQTLTVMPGANATSGTAGIALGGVTMSGNPHFAVNNAGLTIGKLSTGSWIGGGVACTVTQSGAGTLAVTGGITDLPAGSQVTATGGGTLELIFPSLGSDLVVPVTSSQHPLGSAALSLADGTLRLLANGSGNSTAQVYGLTEAISLSGAVTLDANRISGSNANKTFELPGISLAAGGDLSIAGDNAHGIRLSGPLALAGSATLRGSTVAAADGLLTLAGGISGGPGVSLALAGGTGPLNLTIGAASSFGGGTNMTGGNVTLNATGALGSGGLALSGGTLTANADSALSGTVAMSGGVLRVNGIGALAGNPVQMTGGQLDLRANASGAFATGAITVNGSVALQVANNGSGSSQILTVPTLDVVGSSVVTLTNANNYVPNLAGIELAGDLTLSNAITAQVQAISQDATPRRLLKSGAGVLKLQAASTHSGGTEVLAGTLLVEHADALGSGALTLGDVSGTLAASAQFATGLVLSNSVVIRSGGTGTLTLSSPNGGVTWNGPLELQRALAIENPQSTVPSMLAGQITGTGNLTKTGSGTISLNNATNSFSGTVSISSGILEATSDGALGAQSNSITFANPSLIFRANGTFASNRLFTLAASGFSTLQVTAGNTLTLTGGMAGAASLIKSDLGILEIAAGANSVARGAAATMVSGGTLRLAGPNGLSADGPIQFNSNGVTLQLWNDANTDFGHPVNITNPTNINVDRSASGSAIDGRHRLGMMTMTSGSVTITGGNGFGLDLDGIDVKGSSTLTWNGTADLNTDGMTSSTGTSTRNFEIAAGGNVNVVGAISQASSGAINLTKSGAGTLRFGTSVSGFAGAAAVENGTLDLNGSVYQVGGLTFGSGPSDAVPRVLTGASGKLVLAGNLTATVPPGSTPPLVVGTVELTPTAHVFTINDNATQALECTIDGAITGSPGSSLTKASSGTLRLTGADNAYPGMTTVTGGVLELAKPGGGGIGAGGLTIDGGIVRLDADHQIHDAVVPVISSADDSLLELNQHNETLAGLTLAQTDGNDYSGVRTGSSGTLMVLGNLNLSNNANSSGTDARQILITGSGTDTSVANNGILDLGGAVRTVLVTTTTTGQYASKANATIETQVVNGGILKTGPRDLYLTHPNNLLAGGVTIADGRVVLGSQGSLGGSVTFAPTGSAGLVLSQTGGVLAIPLEIGGSGTSTVIYDAASTQLELTGAVTLGSNLNVEVVNGVTSDSGSARLDLSGAVNDGAGTFGLRKTGDGVLLLSNANSFDGPVTIERGRVRTGLAAALGTGTTPLVLAGGCFEPSASMVLGGTVVAGSGSVHLDNPVALELSGIVEWGTGTVNFYGSGLTVLSGSTTAPAVGGAVVVGAPSQFAASWSTATGFFRGHTLSMRGTAALPSGNLSLTHDAVLELGNSDFHRPLGTGDGEVQLGTNRSAGWAAHGANRKVNLGGAAGAVVWGQVSPPFLYLDFGFNKVGSLRLGSATATHTVDIENPLDLSTGGTWFGREIIVPDGPAALEARISGGVSFIPPPDHAATWLDLTVTGALDISGPISGPISINKFGTGTAILSGSNPGIAACLVNEGTLVIGSNASLVAPDFIEVADESVLDASARTLPLTTSVDGEISVEGELVGSVLAPGLLYGSGVVTDHLEVAAGGSFEPGWGVGLAVGGNLTLAAGSSSYFYLDGSAPYEESSVVRATGTVRLDGVLGVTSGGTFDPASLVDPLALIVNSGDDPILGEFDELPEGSEIVVGGIPMRVTYHANTDGGTTGNDLALIPIVVVPVDLALSSDVPASGPAGATVPFTYWVSNPGATAAMGTTLYLTFPSQMDVESSIPPGMVGAGSLTIPLPIIDPGTTLMVTILFTLPTVPGPLDVSASLEAPTDPNDSNNHSFDDITVLATNPLPQPTIVHVAGTGNVTLTFRGVNGETYRLEASDDLDDWQVLEDFTADGTPHPTIVPRDRVRRFFRYLVFP